MDNDNLRRGKLSTHKKFGESTAILAGNSLLTLALEILTDNNLKINNKSKVYLASFISKSSGHEGIAGGQYYDLNFEKKKISLTKILNMQINKTGKLFGFCCVSPLLILDKKKELSKDIQELKELLKTDKGIIGRDKVLKELKSGNISVNIAVRMAPAKPKKPRIRQIHPVKTGRIGRLNFVNPFDVIQ